MTHQFPCQNCGSVLFYEPGSELLKCTSCGTENQIPTTHTEIIEEDFVRTLEMLQKNAPDSQQVQISLLKCTGCGAESSVPEKSTALKCPFCGTPSVLKDKIERQLIRPKYILPFAINKQKALKALKDWIASLWFAPSALKQLARMEDLNGVYIPYWTYDAMTTTDYVGQRGLYYYENETYTVNGKTETRRVQKIRWYPAAGTVRFRFDDVLVAASTSLPTKYARALEPWDLPQLKGFQEEYLSGFQSESYQIDLPHGFEEAKVVMKNQIEIFVRRDIGGDAQRILSMNTQYSELTYKHLLLPVWISAFRFRHQLFRVLVNARTGEVQGERPWSMMKLFCAVFGAFALVYGLMCGYEKATYGEMHYGVLAFIDLLNLFANQ